MVRWPFRARDTWLVHLDWSSHFFLKVQTHHKPSGCSYHDEASRAVRATSRLVHARDDSLSQIYWIKVHALLNQYLFHTQLGDDRHTFASQDFRGKWPAAFPPIKICPVGSCGFSGGFQGASISRNESNNGNSHDS